MKPTPTLLLLAALLSEACELHLSDDPFREGTGRITGTAETNGNPASGALVHIPALSRPVPTAPDGSFLLDNIPAGQHDIIIRAEQETKALRTRATVVDGHTSDLGALALEDAIVLKVIVMDPELPIKDAQVRLQEVPGLKRTTSTNGAALFDCIPPQGTYTATATYLSFQFLPTTGPRESNWEQGLLVEPDPDINQTRAQVHDAYTKLSHLQRELVSCTAECGVPEWWTWQGPPCPVPIGEINEQNDTVEDEWRILANQIWKMERFDMGSWVNLSCPRSYEIQSECLNSRCELMHYDTPPLDSGYAPLECFERSNLIVTNQAEDLADILHCTGAGAVNDAEPDELYVLYQAISEVDTPRLTLVLSDATRCRLFFEGNLCPSKESSEIPTGYITWVLYRLSFAAGQAPPPAMVEAHLSWINPVQ